jgi:hypothetical protein
MSINAVSNSSTLLDMLNNSTTQTDDIFATLVENNNLRCETRLQQLGITTGSDSTQDSYKKVSASASNLSEAANKLSSEELWDENDKDFDRDNVDSAVKGLVSAYNTFMTNIAGVGNSLEKTFKSNLTELTGEYADELNNVGISVGDDGKLNVDDNKLKSAQLSDLKALFGGDSELLGGIEQYASDCSGIVSKALSIQNSMSSLYNSSSDTVDVSSYLSGSAFDSIG